MLRRTRPEDLESLYGIEATCFPQNTWKKEFLRWVLENPRIVGLLWEDRGEAVGSVFVLLKNREAQVMSIAVLAGHRRKGIGRSLLEAAEDLARTDGARVSRLEVSTENEAAIALYRNLGYRTDGVLPKFYASGEDAFAMAKSLEPNT